MDYKITYKSSWLGGKYLLNDEIINLHSLLGNFYIIIGDELINQYQLKPIVTAGVDYDMGHEYKWERNDLSLKVNVYGVPVEINLIEIIQLGKVELLQTL